jgi:hypothetical protein
MKPAPLRIFLLLTFVSAVSAQTPQTCPTISVWGPAGIVSPGQPISFRTKISGQIPSNVGYKWDVSEGEIRRGQGTQNIEVYYSQESGFDLTATLTVYGLPTGCTNIASETYVLEVLPGPVPIDEVAALRSSGDRQRFAAAVGTFKDYPSDFLYIIHYHRGIPPLEITKREQRIAEYLTKVLKVDKANFRIITAEADADRIKIFRVPPGADFPQP